jgi:hypothetical protein
LQVSLPNYVNLFKFALKRFHFPSPPPPPPSPKVFEPPSLPVIDLPTVPTFYD